MGFGKWLKGATRIRFDKRTLGNLTRNVATGAGAVIGGPAGLALAAGGNALGSAIQPGGNLRGALKAAGQGAAAAGGLRAGAGLLNSARGALSSGSAPSVATGGGGAAPAAIPPVDGALDALPTELPHVGITPGTIAPTAAPGAFRSALNAVGDAAGNVGKFAAKNPTAVGYGLQAAGNLATAGTENRMNEAQARLLEQRAGETEYDFEQRKRRDAALAPLWSQLGSTFDSNYSGIARNPYAPAA